MSEYINKDAYISDDGKYRYTLSRQWKLVPFMKLKYNCTFIGLNPSTADAMKDDTTIRRCVNYAKDWGYESLLMVNLFAFRARQPQVMMAAYDPIGPENDRILLEAERNSAIVIAAWGARGTYMNRDLRVREMFKGKLHVLKLTANGIPAHPLYLKKNLRPVPWR